MNETVPSIAVLQTRIPYVDRRSLSEAWFSALHLAVEDPDGATPRTRARSGAASPPAPASPAARKRSIAGYAPPSASRRSAASPQTQAGGIERSRIDARPRALVVVPCAGTTRARSYAAHRTSLTLGVDGTRVQLILRRDGPVLHVIALCRPDVAALVRRALAAADAHVRAYGDSVRASVRTLGDHEPNA